VALGFEPRLSPKRLAGKSSEEASRATDVISFGSMKVTGLSWERLVMAVYVGLPVSGP
jgi:hypothetical protein